MARHRIRRKKSELLRAGTGALESRLRGTKFAGSRVGPADDRFEREADVTANRVVSGAPTDPVFDTRVDPDAPVSAYRSEGMGGAQPANRLPPAELEYFQRKMGFNFANVKINADSQADTMARSINAKAFTRGAEITFAKGSYQPGTMEGRRLLAHELTHVVQQGGGTTAMNSGAPPRTEAPEGSAASGGEISAKAGPAGVQRIVTGKEDAAAVQGPKITPMFCEKKFVVTFLVGKAEIGKMDAKGNFAATQTLKKGMFVEIPPGMIIRLDEGAVMVIRGRSGTSQRLKGFKGGSLFECGAVIKKPDLGRRGKKPVAPTASTSTRV